MGPKYRTGARRWDKPSYRLALGWVVGTCWERTGGGGRPVAVVEPVQPGPGQ